MPSHLHINVKVPLPEGSLLEQGKTLADLNDAISELREKLPAGHEYSDKIVKSSGKPRAARGSRKAAASSERAAAD